MASVGPETVSITSTETRENVKNPDSTIAQAINGIKPALHELNRQIHQNPELCFKEVKAHENIVTFFQEHEVSVKRQAFKLDTSLLAEYGSGGRLVTFCAEYDALPDIGHGCGHNLIAVASVAAFFGVRAALSAMKLPGRIRLLGCPAEEGGGGKIKLIRAGAFNDTDAALMIHPCPIEPDGKDGISYGTCLSTSQYEVIFTGLSAHAGAMPWMGINALDAAALSYSAISMMRQQIQPTDRVNIIIKEGGASSNVITNRAVVQCGARSATKDDLLDLLRRTRNCFEGVAIATKCTAHFVDESEPYAELRPNKSLCSAFSNSMAMVGEKFSCYLDQIVIGGYSTDMGNVSYEVPSFHGSFCIPTRTGQNIHSAGFADAAGSIEAFEKSFAIGPLTQPRTAQ